MAGKKDSDRGPDEPMTEQQFEQAIADHPTGRFVLKLYVTGMTPRSQRAIENIRRLCEQHLAGRYSLEVIDIYQQPALAREEQIIAAPTLIKKLPLPLRRVIGDMSNPGRILVVLGVEPGTAGKGSKPAENP